MPLQTIRVGSRAIGAGHPCYVIAEAGLNHNGDFALAIALIDHAAGAGADAVKFQKRTVDVLAVDAVLDAADNRFPSFGRTYRQIREHLEFDAAEYRDLVEHAQSRAIAFLCTPFDIPALEFLEPLGLPAYKIASHSLTNLPLLRRVAAVGKPVIMSTGMCTVEEIDCAVAIFNEARTPVALLHCVSAYPTPIDQCNLRMLDLLSDRYHVPVGYSGHEIGILPTVASVARGAAVVERHLTTSKTLEGFDHKLSLEPDEFARMVADIRGVEQMLGSGEKAVSATEAITRGKYHVSIVTTTPLAAGTTVDADMLTLKNPGTGLPAHRLPDLLGRRTRCDIPADTLVTAEMFE